MPVTLQLSGINPCHASEKYRRSVITWRHVFIALRSPATFTRIYLQAIRKISAQSSDDDDYKAPPLARLLVNFSLPAYRRHTPQQNNPSAICCGDEKSNNCCSGGIQTRGFHPSQSLHSGSPFFFCNVFCEWLPPDLKA